MLTVTVCRELSSNLPVMSKECSLIVLEYQIRLATAMMDDTSKKILHRFKAGNIMNDTYFIITVPISIY